MRRAWPGFLRKPEVTEVATPLGLLRCRKEQNGEVSFTLEI